MLITSDSSPLKKYLLDKGLGTSLFMYGYESDIFLNFFAVGLKGIPTFNKVVQTERSITAFFSELAKGIDRDQLRGAVNRVELMTRSDASSENSKGVEVYTFLLKYWLYGKDPIELLKYSNYFDFFKKKALETQYFENLITKYFVDNTHCVRSRFAPDSELLTSEELAEQTKLAKIRHDLTEPELDKIIKRNEELKLEQATPDTQADLDMLPMLSIADVSEEVLPYPYILEDDGRIIYTQIPDKKMVHLLLSFDISHVDPSNLPYLALFSKTLFKLGTFGKSEDRFTSELEEVTGELSVRLLFTSDLVTEKKHWKLIVKVSFLESNLDRALALLEEGLLFANFNNTLQLKKIMDEYRVDMENDLVESGHRFALRRSLAPLSQEQHLWDITSGISFYKFLQQVIGEFNTDTLLLTSKADVIRTVVSTNSLQMSLSCSKRFKDFALKQVLAFKARLPIQIFPNSSEVVLPKASKIFYTIPSKVNYVASSKRVNTAINDFGGLNFLLRGIIQYDYLWNEIRVKGGAYGGIAYCVEEGLLGCVSYRDPNLEKTLQVYSQVPKFLAGFDVTDKVLTGYKIGALSDLEPFIDNDALGSENYIKYLTGQTQSVRQAMKNNLLTATQETISNVGILADSKSTIDGSITVLGNINTIQDKAYFDSIEQLA
jgi:Zn-dependent M16 (insulinase) family peptidase